MRTYTIRLNGDQGIVAITTSANDWMQAVQQVLSAEGAPSSAYRNCFEHLEEGDTVWGGAKIGKHQAAAYNRVNDHIHAWKAIGKEPPEQLLNGRHNILANVA
jgi:hypothetical protein